MLLIIAFFKKKSSQIIIVKAILLFKLIVKVNYQLAELGAENQ